MGQILPPDWIEWLTIFNTFMSVLAAGFLVISGIYRFFVKPNLKLELHTHDSRAPSALPAIECRVLNATVTNEKKRLFGKTATHCEGRLVLEPDREHPLPWIDYGDRQVIDLTPGNSATLELMRVFRSVGRATIRLPSGSETEIKAGIYKPVLRVVSKERCVERGLGEYRIPHDLLEKPVFRIKLN